MIASHRRRHRLSLASALICSLPFSLSHQPDVKSRLPKVFCPFPARTSHYLVNDLLWMAGKKHKNQNTCMKTILLLSSRRPSIFAAMLLLAGLTRAAAQSLISNTDQPGFGLFPTVFAGQWVAAPFRTGADPARLDSISLYEWTFADLPAGTFSVSIWGDQNGQPSAVLAGGGLSGPSVPLGAAFQSYTSAAGISLAANTEYWVVASSDVADYSEAYTWGTANTTSYSSSFGWQFFDHYDWTPNHGTTWNVAEGTDYGNNFGPQLLAINGVIVPEPSSWTLLGLGTVGFLLLRLLAASRRHSA
jgi:hypothetical protein